MSRARNIADTGDNNLDDIVVDGSGNVGIGTSSPSRILHINSGTNNNCALFESSDANADIYLQDSNATGNTSVGLRGQGNNLIFITGGTEGASLNSSGTFTATSVDAKQSSETAIGATVMGWINNSTTSHGGTRAGTVIYWSNASATSTPSTLGVGTWRCHGRVLSGTASGEVTVWQRIS